MQDTAKPKYDPLHAYQVQNPEQFGQNMMRLFEEGGKVMSDLIGRSGTQSGPMSGSGDTGEAARALGEVTQHWMREPGKLAEVQADLLRNYMELWSRTMQRLMGEHVDPVIEPEVGDNRFKDADWSENPYFDFWKQAYLMTSRWSEELVTKSQGLDERTRHKAEFYMRQIATATSPSNFPMTNPEVLREIFASNGENLLRGLTHLAEDMARSDDLLKITQTDTSAFEVGRNVAMSPGKVVFQNDILQLIQYAPTTGEVHQVPLMVVPPWINKFYILDLQPTKSFIKYAVDQGFTVFVVSWVNPDERLAGKTFSDYMREGILEGADAVSRQTGVEKINVLGYCVGGTLLGTTLAWLAANHIERFRSATFLAAQVDFSKAGDLLVFIDDAQLKALEEMMAERGYLDGSRMANVFNMLRPRDLIWPYIINNYMLGKKPFPFDLLYWNQDSTRMPAANHGFYLREFYHENRLASGKMIMGGVKLDLAKVRLPIYHLATREDHIAPAKSVFIGAKMFGSPLRYVLAGSGHIAGVVNPPEKIKYQHWTNDGTAATYEEWLGAASEHPGSWWPDWAAWLAGFGGEKVPARDPAAGPLPAIEDAPGSYVRTKS